MNLGLQRKTDLALIAVAVLARSEGLVHGAELARRVDTTTSFLPQVMSPLVKSGWVTSERGPRGGYQLTAAGRQVNLLDVVEVSEGPIDSGRCVLRHDACPGEVLCPVHDAWVQARQVLIDRLAASSVDRAQLTTSRQPI